MYIGSLYHGDIINAFQRNVPNVYVRDYRDRGGFIVIFQGTKTIDWAGQMSTRQQYRNVPDKTLVNLPRGNVTRRSLYYGLKLHRPGWITEFARAAQHLTHAQKRRIEKALGGLELFPVSK